MRNNVAETTSPNGVYYRRKVRDPKSPLADFRAHVRIVLLGGLPRAFPTIERGWDLAVLSTSAALLLAVQPDLFLVNFPMGRSAPGEQLRQLRERFPTVPVVVIVPPGEEGLVLSSLLGGACGCITKPVLQRELREAILKAISGGLALNRNAEKALLRAIHEAGVPCFGLTRREEEVLALLCKRASDKDIAQKLGISPGTVHVHLAHLFKKLRVHNRTQAVSKYPSVK